MPSLAMDGEAACTRIMEADSHLPGAGDSPKTEYVALADPSTTFEGTFSDNFSDAPVPNKKDKYKNCLNYFLLPDQDPTSHFS